MSSKNIIRFELEFDDGTIERISGEDAAKYVKSINDIIGFHGLRSGNFHPLPRVPKTVFKKTGEEET